MAGHGSATLYAGDLDKSVTEANLYELFNQVGPVMSIRVCRDAFTRRSLGYAYINFHNPVDAERALDTLNYTAIKGRPVRLMWSQRDPSLRRSGVGNIFIKNLDASIDNKALFDTFSVFGNILSCKVAVDETGASRGYGFVHYETGESADQAIARVNGMLLAGKKVHVVRFVARRDRSDLPGSDSWTNVFVKNLAEDVTEEALRELFSQYGEITSLVLFKGKIPDRDSEFAMRAQEEEDEEAIIRESEEEDKKKEEEEGEKKEEEGEKKEEEEEEKAEEEEKKEEEEEEKKAEEEEPATPQEPPKYKGYGFINFADTEAAQRAVSELNGFLLMGKPMYVGRAQKKFEREQELRTHFEQMKVERQNKYQGVNLYVKNLDDTIDDEKLRTAFAAFGTITSAKVMRDERGVSKGFGFVCFSSPEEATRCVTEMNGRVLGSKPIYVALAQRKDDRRRQLEAQYVARASMQGGPGQMRPGQPGQPMAPMMAGAPLYYAPAGAMGAGRGQGQRMMYPQQMVAAQPRWTMPGQMAPQPGAAGGAGQRPMVNPYGQPAVPYMTPQQAAQMQAAQAGRGRRPNGRGAAPPSPTQQKTPAAAAAAAAAAAHAAGVPPAAAAAAIAAAAAGAAAAASQPQQSGAATAAARGFKLTPNARNPDGAATTGVPPTGPGQQPMAAVAGGNVPLDLAAFAQSGPEQQKNLLGERLFPLVTAIRADQAGKITGMLLEMDNGELIHLLESPEALQSKVQEAVVVLEAHAATQQRQMEQPAQ